MFSPLALAFMEMLAVLISSNHLVILAIGNLPEFRLLPGFHC